ncbi:hypothetical protein BH09VER1_BH09VER1_51320 [soil metagenome]
MRTLVIVCVLALVGVLVALFGFRWFFEGAEKGGPEGPFGFREILKDGEKRAAMNRMMDPKVDGMSEAEIARAVDGYVHSQGQSREYWMVRALQERAVPDLLKSLGARDAMVVPVVANWSNPDTPMQRALDMLWPYRRAEMVPYLLPVLAQDNYWLRAAAGLNLASLGSDEVIEPVLKALADPEQHVQDMTCNGMEFALKEGRATPGFRKAMSGPLEAEFEDPKGKSSKALKLLMELDAARTIALINTPRFLSPDQPKADEVLVALGEQGVPVDEKLLWALIEANPPKVKWDAGTDVYCAAMSALAAQHVPGADKLVADALAEKLTPEEKALKSYARARIQRQEAAVKALWKKENLPDPMYTAETSLDAAKGDYAKIPEAQRDILLVEELDGEVCNGGFDQYYLNSSGNNAREALAALKRMADTERAVIMQASMDLFGSKGPSADREKRNAQQEKMTDEQGEKMGKLDTAWYAVPESLEVAIYYYCLGRKGEFGGK